jgi:hypothetical protein
MGCELMIAIQCPPFEARRALKYVFDPETFFPKIIARVDSIERNMMAGEL